MLRVVSNAVGKSLAFARGMALCGVSLAVVMAYTRGAWAQDSPDGVGFGVFPSMRVGVGWGAMTDASTRRTNDASGVNFDLLGDFAMTFGRDRFAVVAATGVSLVAISASGVAYPSLTLRGVPVLATFMWSPIDRLSFQVGGGAVFGSLTVAQDVRREAEADAIAARVHAGLTWLVTNRKAFTLGLSVEMNHASGSSAVGEFTSTGAMLGVSLAFNNDALAVGNSSPSLDGLTSSVSSPSPAAPSSLTSYNPNAFYRPAAPVSVAVAAPTTVRPPPRSPEAIHQENIASQQRMLGMLRGGWSNAWMPALLAEILRLRAADEPALASALVAVALDVARDQGGLREGPARVRANALAGVVEALAPLEVLAPEAAATRATLRTAAVSAFEAAIDEAAGRWRSLSDWIAPDARDLRREVTAGADAATVERLDRAAQTVVEQEFDAIREDRHERQSRALRALSLSALWTPSPAFLRRALTTRREMFAAAVRTEHRRLLRGGHPWAATLFARRLLALDSAEDARWVEEAEGRGAAAMIQMAGRHPDLDGLSVLHHAVARALLRAAAPPPSEMGRLRHAHMLLQMNAREHARCGANARDVQQGVMQFLAEPESRGLTVRGEILGCPGSAPGPSGALRYVVALAIITPAGATTARLELDARAQESVTAQTLRQLSTYRAALPPERRAAAFDPQRLLASADGLRTSEPWRAIDLYVWARRLGEPWSAERQQWISGQYGVSPDDLPTIQVGEM